ncbi:hypothetical protein BC826DRAFT_260593 [Russula brevipes]|nr:hypothetical protein BC826DRAFT_260593 [Russula brevipes]
MLVVRLSRAVQSIPSSPLPALPRPHQKGSRGRQAPDVYSLRRFIISISASFLAHPSHILHLICLNDRWVSPPYSTSSRSAQNAAHSAGNYLGWGAFPETWGVWQLTHAQVTPFSQTAIRHHTVHTHETSYQRREASHFPTARVNPISCRNACALLHALSRKI